MIVGSAICKILDGMTIDVDGSAVTVKNNMGNQDALDKFIAASDKLKASKFPLIFYVIAPVKEFKNWKYCTTDLIIMTNTDSDLLYKDRAAITYVPYIEPIYQKVKETLTEHSFYQSLEPKINERFSYTDVPNFGITKNDIGTGTSKKSVITDYVDARIIKMNFKINTNCI